MKLCNISEMVGQIFTSVRQDGDTLVFENGQHIYKLEHRQNCCESVYIEDICGDLKDLENSVLRVAEEVSSKTPADFDSNRYDSYTWTFYKFRTLQGYVDVRWFGSSNGYYSESVSLYKAVK